MKWFKNLFGNLKMWDSILGSLCIGFLFLFSNYYVYWKVIVEGAFWSDRFTIYQIEEYWRLCAVLLLIVFILLVIVNVIRFVKWLRWRKAWKEIDDYGEDPSRLPFE